MTPGMLQSPINEVFRIKKKQGNENIVDTLLETIWSEKIEESIKILIEKLIFFPDLISKVLTKIFQLISTHNEEMKMKISKFE